MTASPQGCGVLEHPEECLCDVIITKPTEFKSRIPFDIDNGPAIAYFGNWDGTLLHWFEISRVAFDAVHLARTRPDIPPSGKFARKLPNDVYDYLVEGIRNGKQPTPLRQEIIDLYGYTISKSYVTHLRKRLQKRGQLDEI